MSYQVIASGCYDGDCPTIHIDRDRNTVAIQGYVVQDPEMTAPDGETLVEMPLATFAQLAGQLIAQTATTEEINA